MGRTYAGTYRTSQNADVVWAALPTALEACAFDIKESSDTERTLEAKKNMKKATVKTMGRTSAKATWGEKLRATVRTEGDRSTVSLESRLVFGLIDWGENRRNVDNVCAELDRLLAHPSEGKR